MPQRHKVTESHNAAKGLCYVSKKSNIDVLDKMIKCEIFIGFKNVRVLKAASTCKTSKENK